MAITAAFGLAYPLLRSLSDTKCALLHYDPVPSGSDLTELCRSEEALFLDLDRGRFSVEMELMTDGDIELGVEARFSLRFAADGRPDIPVGIGHSAHGEGPPPGGRFESRRLPSYHLKLVGSTGTYEFDLVPARVDFYSVFSEIVPLASRSVVIVKSTF